jgi:diguanylate cyclase (GGDEF)-like protein/PAS domain S-box-containing protein
MTGVSIRELAFLRNPLPALLLDAAARVVDVNDAFLEITRRTRDEVLGAFTVNFIHADDLAGTLDAYAELEAGAPLVRQQRRHLRGDGTWVAVEALMSRFLADGEQYLLVQLLEHHDAPDVRVDDEAQTRLLLQPFGDAACFHDADGRIGFATANLAELLGRPIGWFHGRRLTDPELQPVDADGRPIAAGDDPVVESLRKGEDVIRTVGLCSTTGDVTWFSVRAGPVAAGRLPARSTLRDVSELVRAQEAARLLAGIVERELAHRADHDSLTELKARHVIVRAIEARLEVDAPVSVVFVDLDGFKAINDDHGHLAGDEVLVAVAGRLRELAPPGATLGRSGGDEFVAVIDDRVLAEYFAAEVRDRVLTSPPQRALRASVGVAHSRADDTPRQLLQRADDAMYAAKRSAERS